MDTIISFTPAQLIGIILAVSTAIITINQVIGIIANALRKVKQPEINQDERIRICESRLDKMDGVIEKFREYFSNDDRRFREIEKGNIVTQTALLALLKHSLNGNDTKALREAEKSLEEYLINK